MKRVFGRPGQRIGERIFLRLLEHDRVVDDRGGLLAHAIEQPAVVVGVAARVDVIDRQRADEPLVEHQRADQRRLQRRGARDAGRFEVGARARVHQRAAVARHPAGQPEAALHGNLLNDFGVDAGRKPAAQRLELFVVQEERAARERHEVAQLRRDQRHRVGDAEAGAHRLGDFVERVDFAMRERDVVEHGLVRRLRQQPDGRAPLLVRAGRQRQRAHRLGRRFRFGAQLLEVLDEHQHEVRIERLAGFLAQQPDRAFVAHRLVIRPLRRQRVEVVDDRKDARAGGDFVALHAGRVALAVPALVVAQDERRDGIGKRHARDDLGADLRVNPNLLELFLRERARLRENVLGHRQLADVVQQRGRLHALNLVLRHADALSRGRRRTPARAGCATCPCDPSRRSRARALRSSRDAGPTLPARGAARLRCGPDRSCSCDRSGTAAARPAARSSSWSCRR